MSNIAWVKLERGDDWGVDYFSLPGRARRNGTCSIRYGLRFVDGQPLTVRWPDGTVGAVHVAHQSRQVSIGDMGHRYETGSNTPGFVVTDRGLTSDVLLLRRPVSPRNGLRLRSAHRVLPPMHRRGVGVDSPPHEREGEAQGRAGQRELLRGGRAPCAALKQKKPSGSG